MNIINSISLDWRNVPLRTKKRDALNKLKQTSDYNAYVIKANGEVLKYERSDKTKQGYTLKTLKPSEYTILTTPVIY